MSDDIADREHPAAEKLSAYLADELSAEENDAIQEHVASCSLCAERLLDLQRFLEFAPLESPQGVADFETAAEWAKLRARIRRDIERKGFFASARGGYSVAAALLVVSVGLAVWNLSLVRESRQPRPLATMRTLEAEESFRGRTETPREEPIFLPAQITLSLPVKTSEPLYRIDLLSESQGTQWSFTIPPQGTELRFLLPKKALAPGQYSIRAHGLRNGHPSQQAWTYELTIGPQRL